MRADWSCVNCAENGQHRLVNLDQHGRCERCGSDAVTIPVTPFREMNGNSSIVYKPQ